MQDGFEEDLEGDTDLDKIVMLGEFNILAYEALFCQLLLIPSLKNCIWIDSQCKMSRIF